MALKCTNTSEPPSWVMKPYPLSALNHFTMPVATSNPSFPGRAGPRSVRWPPGSCRARSARSDTAGSDTATGATLRTRIAAGGLQVAPGWWPNPPRASNSCSGGRFSAGPHPFDHPRDVLAVGPRPGPGLRPLVHHELAHSGGLSSEARQLVDDVHDQVVPVE